MKNTFWKMFFSFFGPYNYLHFGPLIFFFLFGHLILVWFAIDFYDLFSKRSCRDLEVSRKYFATWLILDFAKQNSIYLV